MLNDNSSILTLLVQNPYTVFCYFNVSPIIVKEFEDRYGENFWKNSKPVLKVYQVVNGDAIEIKTIYIDSLANNWFINLKDEGIDVFVKLGRMLPDDKFAAFAVSNTVSTPNDNQSKDNNVYYVDVSQDFEGEINNLPVSKEGKNVISGHKEPKPYPFLDEKKISYYPEIIISSNNSQDTFMNMYIKDSLERYIKFPSSPNGGKVF